MQIPTIRVVAPVSDENPLGFIVINEEDLADDHELFVDPTDGAAPAEADKPAKPTAKAAKAA